MVLQTVPTAGWKSFFLNSIGVALNDLVLLGLRERVKKDIVGESDGLKINKFCAGYGWVPCQICQSPKRGHLQRCSISPKTTVSSPLIPASRNNVSCLLAISILAAAWIRSALSRTSWKLCWAIGHWQSSATFLVYPFSEQVDPQQDNGHNVLQDKVVGGVDS